MYRPSIKTIFLLFYISVQIQETIEKSPWVNEGNGKCTLFENLSNSFFSSKISSEDLPMIMK